MKGKQSIGFATLLLGLIFAVSGERVIWGAGVVLGVIGVVIVILGAKTE